MRLTKEILRRVIEEELSSVESEFVGPMELEKQLEPLIAAYLGRPNDDASYQMIENFIEALMGLKTDRQASLEEATREETEARMADIMNNLTPADKEAIAAKSKKEKEDPNNPWMVSGLDGDIPGDIKTSRKNKSRYKGR